MLEAELVEAREAVAEQFDTELRHTDETTVLRAALDAANSAAAAAAAAAVSGQVREELAG
jgi:hypothetical protein